MKFTCQFYGDAIDLCPKIYVPCAYTMQFEQLGFTFTVNPTSTIFPFGHYTGTDFFRENIENANILINTLQDPTELQTCIMCQDQDALRCCFTPQAQILGLRHKPITIHQMNFMILLVYISLKVFPYGHNIDTITEVDAIFESLNIKDKLVCFALLDEVAGILFESAANPVLGFLYTLCSKSIPDWLANLM
ncbi:hypothetical protein ACJX0J_034805, partial [Zea mays]